MSNLIIFDLDGVITSEEAYWDAAGLTLHELLYSPRYWNLDKSQPGTGGQYHPPATAQESRRISRATFPESEILALKARAINSNWDTCYATVCLHLIYLLALLKRHQQGVLPFPLQPWDAGWIAAFREQMAGVMAQKGDQASHSPLDSADGWTDTPQQCFHTTTLAQFFEAPTSQGCIGLELINRLDAYASEVAGSPIRGVFSRYSPFWTFCQDIFQEWYLGDDLYTQTYGHAPAQPAKPGCIYFEQPLIAVEEARATLETLRQQGYVLGIATGRVRQEAVYPLKMYGLLEYFDDQHISTYDDVERAEGGLRAHSDQTLLGKPHPFQFLMALDRNSLLVEAQSLASTMPSKRGDFVAVGDSTSDILGGRRAGALTVAVSTGLRTAEAKVLLAQSKPDFTIDDITKLPALLAHIDSLATIQRLQFTDREKAERLLQHWFARHLHLATESVTLAPKAVSLNSFNGFYRSDGEEYFFKTHVEEQGVLEEYYHAELLYQAGYNIVKPLRVLREEGRQMVIYPVMHWPVMFDLVRALEMSHEDAINRVPTSTEAGNTQGRTLETLETLASAEQEECKRLLNIYQSTLALSTAEEHAHAPIHQLFWHRLAGERFKSFYAGKHVPFLGGNDAQGSDIPFNTLLKYRWVINGVDQQHTLGELVERAKVVLHPARTAMTIIGHGDAHFGNVFLENQRSYLYFDPAFAGRHTPLLDAIKPLFHNVFATWMYFPYDIARNLRLSVSVQETTIMLEHDYTLTPVRQAVLQAKIQHLLVPLIAELRSRNALPADWLEMMCLALMCCPLLTINLLDGARIPAAISWLGLSQAVQLGNTGIQPWRIDL